MKKIHIFWKEKIDEKGKGGFRMAVTTLIIKPGITLKAVAFVLKIGLVNAFLINDRVACLLVLSSVASLVFTVVV